MTLLGDGTRVRVPSTTPRLRTHLTVPKAMLLSTSAVRPPGGPDLQILPSRPLGIGGDLYTRTYDYYECKLYAFRGMEG
eukprot:5105925-Pleurochrysis_carterae.AAC.1